MFKNRGFLYSTFGPLWYSWGGDHVSGVNDINNGYNHLLMNDREYKNYLSSFEIILMTQMMEEPGYLTIYSLI